MNSYTHFDLSSIESCSEIPACRGAEVLAILVEVDPISDEEKKRYSERVEKSSRNYIWRKLTGDITIKFLDAAVERMFNARRERTRWSPRNSVSCSIASSISSSRDMTLNEPRTSYNNRRNSRDGERWTPLTKSEYELPATNAPEFLRL